jgi:arylsulfatase A-like enzyme/Flp pilus assembly protein TadD
MGKANRRKQRADTAVSPAQPRARRSLRTWTWLLVPVLAGGAVAFYVGLERAHAPRYAFGSLKGGNVVLITLDTTRADHLPAYGYKGVSTPGLDRLAGTSLVFEHAIAHVPSTLPSHASILTGLLPIAHGIRDNKGYTLDPKIATLAEILKDRGYRTAAFVSAFVLDSRWGLDQGFDLYFDRFNPYQGFNRDEVQRRAEETEAEVERWLPTHADQPFFLWVHFYDPHKPYEPPEPFFSAYASNRYDGEIAYMDQSVGRLLSKLDELRLADRTLVIVTGDHGEGLGEHGEGTHGMFVYRTTVHVPLFIQLPDRRPQRIRGVVGHIDLAPTILELLGIPPPTDMQGSSLIPLINGSSGDDRTAYSESLHAQLHYGWSPLTSLTTRTYDFIDAPGPELYDHAADPGQLRNLVAEKSAVADDLKEQLHDVLALFGRSDLQGPKRMDADTEARLRALGYVGSTVQPTDDSLKIDPKDKLQVVGAIERGAAAFARGEFRRALQLVLPVTQTDPEILEAHYLAGASFAYLQLYDQAIDQLFKVLAGRPDQTMALATLGWAYEGKGDFKEAERWYLKVFQYEKDHGFTVLKLANLYRLMRQPGKAEAYLSKAVGPITGSLETTSDPDLRSKLYANRAEMYFGAGRLSEAGADLQAAIALAPRAPSLHFSLARVYEQKDDIPNAILNYQAETQVAASNFNAYMKLGVLYLDVRQFEEAASCFRAMRRLAPEDPRPGLLLAESYLRMDRNLDEALQLARQSLAQAEAPAEIYTLIGSIEAKLGHEQEASAAFARSRELQARQPTTSAGGSGVKP